MAKKRKTMNDMRVQPHKNNQQQGFQKTVPIIGMHCASCELLIMDELESIKGVTSANVSLRTKSATITSTEGISYDSITKAVEAAGYEIGTEPDKLPLISGNINIWKDVIIGLLVIAMLYIVYRVFGLDKAMAALTGGGGSNGTVALVIGLTAGFSTCMALIGGLVISVASKYAENHPTQTPLQKFMPHIFFNLGRILSFIVLGALIGAIGSAFALKGTALGLLTIAVGAVMLILGLQLTEVFPRIKKGLTLPSGLAKKLGITARKDREYSHKNAFFMGAATFFLPCGFTQAMQLLAVSTGSPIQAAIIMGAFAIGTAPGLLSLGGLTSIVKGAFARRFFRIVGVVVVAMAMLNFSNGLTLAGVKLSLDNLIPKSAPSSSVSSAAENPGTTGDSVVLNAVYKSGKDISPSKFTAKVGQKTTLAVDVQDNGTGCMSTIMIIGLNDTPQYLQKGKTILLDFVATEPGTYTIACAMGIPRGSITVTE